MFILRLIFSRMPFAFATVTPRYFNFSTFSSDKFPITIVRFFYFENAEEFTYLDSQLNTSNIVLNEIKRGYSVEIDDIMHIKT